MSDVTVSRDHADLSDTQAARRYFAKFARITRHLVQVAAEMQSAGSLTRIEAGVMAPYVGRLARSFSALGLKYLFTGRDTGTFFGSLTMDRHESGFPVFRELLTMANDAQQAERHLSGMPSAEQLKDAMVREIVGELQVPLKRQFALSQRLYYEALLQGDLFWAQNDPDVEILDDGADGGRRRYLVHWAVYDSQTNLPTLYLMELEDSGRRPLPRDERRWPEVQARLVSQSLGGLKLVTIATGFDQDFDDLHPKALKRIHLGPMMSHAFTLQSGPIRDVLAAARGGPGEDWALVWTLETLESSHAVEEKAGWFSRVDREVFLLDPFGGRGAETGATRTERAIILPERPYQVLAEMAPPGFRDVTKYVVRQGGQVLTYR